MKNSRASERYAKSLLELSIDKDLVEEIKSDIDMLIIIFSESREVSNLYLSPIIPSWCAQNNPVGPAPIIKTSVSIIKLAFLVN